MAEQNPTAPITVEQAMATVMTLARKLDLTDAPPPALDDLADLTERLATVVRTASTVKSAQVLARQNQDLTGEHGRALAESSSAAAHTARGQFFLAHQRLAEALTKYDSHFGGPVV